ncbi:MAG: DUF2924 domain-containing protein [Deltaproteobacteria bacterium]|nr:DUF2924 domain-containing protein [Deltaproteobacteria bacterium]
MNKATTRSRAEMRRLDDMPSQLAALETMNVPALAEKYRELYGEPTRSRNRAYLKKRLAWRIEANFQGDLSQGAIARIQQLGDQLPERWQMRLGQAASEPAAAGDAATKLDAALSTPTTEPRDPRVPPVGTVVRRVFDGKTHEVTVCVEGFEYEGRKYKTLSAIANQIAGSRWNGFLFFGLKKRGDAASEESAA